MRHVARTLLACGVIGLAACGEGSAPTAADSSSSKPPSTALPGSAVELLVARGAKVAGDPRALGQAVGAVHHRDPEGRILEFLLAHGGDVNAKDAGQRTAWDRARESRGDNGSMNLDVMEMIERAGGRSGKDLPK